MTKKPAAKSAAKTAAKPAPAPRAAGAASGVDAGLVRELAGLLSETDLTEIEVEKGDMRIRLSRETRYAAMAAPAPGAIAVPAVPPAPLPVAADGSNQRTACGGSQPDLWSLPPVQQEVGLRQP